MHPTAQGLTSHEAARKLKAVGYNSLAETPPTHPIVILVRQIKSPLIYILLAAAAITFFLADFIDSTVILLAVIINTILGFVQEWKAERTLLALKKVLSPQAKVVRDGAAATVPASTIVPGDVVMISAGDKIPADGTIIETVKLTVNEAMLTGESQPVEKQLHKEAYMGTIVASGRGALLITKTGMTTEIGKIADAIGETEEQETPLQKELGELARQLALIVIVVCTLIFLLGLFFGEELLSMFSTSVAVAVSAIPEGMMVSLTVILALGMQRILRRHAVVRKLVAAETLGSVSTLCIDKTGTLTQGVMKVVESDITDREKAVNAAVIANNLEDPFEIAIWDWARGQNHTDPQLIADAHRRKDEIPFDSTHKYMAVATNGDVWIKGAPEIIIKHSALTDHERDKWLTKAEQYGKKGLRLLAFAWKKRNKDKALDKEIHSLTFLGIVGVSDPAREGVSEALESLAKAGVSVKVVTGDYRITSETVLKHIGMPIKHPSSEIMDGQELNDISQEELREKVRSIRLFCRVTPVQKLKIVMALQDVGEVVAMTGDGVNDAMALKKAEIGIVVDSASDVAKETADIVLLDSNLNTIVATIAEGRGIFENIRKVVMYLLSNAFAEMVLIILSILTRMPLPLTATQILWINIISDGFPNLALTIDPYAPDLMRRKPRNMSDPIVNDAIKIITACVSLAVGVSAFLLYTVYLFTTHSQSYAQTIVFAVVGTSSLVYVFSSKHLGERVSVSTITENWALLSSVIAGFAFQLLAIYHPWAPTVFSAYPLVLSDWIIIIASGAFLIVIIEFLKVNLHRKLTRQS